MAATSGKNLPSRLEPGQRQLQWILRAAPSDRLRALVAHPAAAGLPDALLQILAARLEGDADVQRFLEPLLKNLSDPFDLPDVSAAVARIHAAIAAGERIALFGDYDVDGVTSVALMAEVLAAYGAKAACILPRRQGEGYGLTTAAVARCLQENPGTTLIIALDCGSNSREQAAQLAASGVDLVVLDHHETSVEQMADCVAVVNPKRPDGGSHAYLCSVGIVFKVAHALLRHHPVDSAEFDLRNGLDLVALGTVADVVPLVGENRILVKRGLDRIERGARPGIVALCRVAGVRADAVRKASSIGFMLGPRINAAGRLGDAMAALELVRAEDASRAADLAGELDFLNRERRRVEQEILVQAEEMAREQLARAEDPALVLSGDGWHAGVAGIVAARITRMFHRPTLVVGFDERGQGKGSGRSVPGFDLFVALDGCRDHLEACGGHDQAVGLTIRREKLGDFRAAFVTAVEQLITAEQLRPKLFLDAEIRLQEITGSFLAGLARFEPFGNSNPEPLFIARGVQPAGQPRWLKDKHLKFRAVQGPVGHDAVYFNCPVDPPSPPWDIAFVIGENHYKGRCVTQLVIRGIRQAQRDLTT